MHSVYCVGIQKTFGRLCALVDVTVHIDSSMITALIGPNGAGKTTLFDILTGFVRPDSGQCFVRGYETTNLPAYRVAQYGITRTFQKPRLIFQIPVVDNVLLAFSGGRMEKLAFGFFSSYAKEMEAINRKHALELLRMIGLDKNPTGLPSDLSYGQQKLLAIAICLATGAEIVFLDEPFGGIHAEFINRICALLAQLRTERKTVILIEHNIGIVRRIADCVIVLKQGSVVAHGKTEEVLKHQS